MLIILDASTIISTLVSRKKSYTRDILRLSKRKLIDLAVCEESFNELRDYNSHIVGVFIVWYQYNGIFYSLKDQKINTFSRDIKDNIYIELSQVCKAQYLVTADKDLLVLKYIGNTKITTPKQFIKNFKFDKN